MSRTAPVQERRRILSVIRAFFPGVFSHFRVPDLNSSIKSLAQLAPLFLFYSRCLRWKKKLSQLLQVCFIPSPVGHLPHPRIPVFLFLSSFFLTSQGQDRNADLTFPQNSASPKSAIFLRTYCHFYENYKTFMSRLSFFAFCMFVLVHHSPPTIFIVYYSLAYSSSLLLDNNHYCI